MESASASDRTGALALLDQVFVATLRRNGSIGTPRVEAAFRAVPRRLFLPGVPLSSVYRNEAIVIRRLDGAPVSSSSQPGVMAMMLEQLQLEPGHSVLEIGTGSGYNAALLSHIVAETGRVVTLEIDECLVTEARKQLAAAGFDGVQVVSGDGGFGYPAGAPYDRIILTTGARDIAPAWREQLKPGGRLVLPLSIRGSSPQVSVAFEQANGYLASVSIRSCGFLMLRGAFAGPEANVRLGPEPGLSLAVDNPTLVHGVAVYRLLTGPSRDLSATVRVTLDEIERGLSLWLALREPGFCGLSAEGERAERGIVPCLFSSSGDPKMCFTPGVVGDDALCVLMRPPGDFRRLDDDWDSPFDLFVKSLGPDSGLAHRFIERIRGWDTSGRPSVERLYVRAHPAGTDYVPDRNEIVIDRRWTRFVFAM